jgi:chemotaxis protein MotB
MKKLMLVVAVAALLATGCTTVQKGAAIGGAAGAAVGGVWGASAGSLNAGEGALAGAAGGGLVGALIGDQLDKVKKEDLQREIQNLKDQLAAKERALAEKDARIKDLEKQIAALKDALAEKERALKELEDKLKDLQAQLDRMPKRITLTIADRLLFASGSDKITTQGRQLLDRVAAMLKEKYSGREISIEGNTDTEPIRYSSWKSNWELGAARALSVVHYLVDKHRFDPARISATTYSEFRPRADNTTKEGKSENRRAVIVILPEIQTERVELK